MSRLSVVGKVSRLFGLDGGLMINLYDTFPAEINLEEPLYVLVDTLAVPLFFEKFERRGQKGAVVAFADIDTPERATEFIGTELLMKDSAVQVGDDDDELYLEDLVGFDVEITEQGRKDVVKGSVTGFTDNEMNPLFSLEIGGVEVFVPAADDFITRIDVGAHKLRMTLPEGLLDLYL